MNEKLIMKLNHYLADTNVLFRKIQNYHWNIVGNDFITVHPLLQTMYEQLDQQIDDIAERILTIGGQPIGTMKGYLELSDIQEAHDQKVRSSEILPIVLQDFTHMLAVTKEVKTLADDAGDYGTSAFIDDAIQQFEKTLWILNATLQS